jgi:hypothetical protein
MKTNYTVSVEVTRSVNGKVVETLFSKTKRTKNFNLAKDWLEERIQAYYSNMGLEGNLVIDDTRGNLSNGGYMVNIISLDCLGELRYGNKCPDIIFYGTIS